MPSPVLIGYTPANTDPLPLAFYQNLGDFQMTAGVEYYIPAAGDAADLFIPFIGQGQIPDQPGVWHEGYPVYFSILDADADGVVEWVRYIEVYGEIRILFAAEWNFRGGIGYEIFPIPASAQVPVVDYSAVTLVLVPDHTRPGSIVLRGIALEGVASFPPSTYIEFVTSQTGPTTIETVGSIWVDGSRVADVSFVGVYNPSSSSVIPALDYNTPR